MIQIKNAMTGDQFVKKMAEGKVGIRHEDAIRRYKEIKQLIKDACDLEVGARYRNMTMIISNGSLHVTTKLKKRDRITDVKINDYFDNRKLLTLPERRLLVKILDTIPYNGMQIPYVKTLSDLYGVFFNIEFIAGQSP